MTTDGLFDHVLKIKPPLVFSMEDAKHMCACLQQALCEMQNNMAAVAALQAGLIAKHAPGQMRAQQYFFEWLDEPEGRGQQTDPAKMDSMSTGTCSAASTGASVPA